MYLFFGFFSVFVKFIDQILESVEEDPLWKIISKLLTKLESQYDSDTFQCQDKSVAEQVNQSMKNLGLDDDNSDESKNNENDETDSKQTAQFQNNSKFDCTPILNNLQLFTISRIDQYLSTHFLTKTYKKKLITCFKHYQGDDETTNMKKAIIEFLEIDDITVFDEPQEPEEQEEEQNNDDENDETADEDAEKPDETKNDQNKNDDKPAYNPIYSQILDGLQSDEMPQLFEIITRLINLKLKMSGIPQLLEQDMLNFVDQFITNKAAERAAKLQEEENTETQENE